MTSEDRLNFNYYLNSSEKDIKKICIYNWKYLSRPEMLPDKSYLRHDWCADNLPKKGPFICSVGKQTSVRTIGIYARQPQTEWSSGVK